MSRSVAVVGPWLAERLEFAEPVFALLTQVGDTWLLGGLAVFLYVLGDTIPGWDRRRGAAVLAAVLLAVAATGLLKTILAIPRPAGAGTAIYAVPGLGGEVYDWAATADGFGFPSGHALATTAVYGTIAALVDPEHRRRAAFVAAALVVGAAVSRLALGVHLLVDVFAGFAVGLVVAFVATRWATRPVVTFGVAVPTAAAWALVAGGDPTAVGAVGISVGALLAWSRFGDRLLATRGARTAGLAVGALVLAGLTLVVVEFGGPAVAAAAGVVGMAAVVALPLAEVTGRLAQKVSR